MWILDSQFGRSNSNAVVRRPWHFTCQPIREQYSQLAQIQDVSRPTANAVDEQHRLGLTLLCRSLAIFALRLQVPLPRSIVMHECTTRENMSTEKFIAIVEMILNFDNYLKLSSVVDTQRLHIAFPSTWALQLPNGSVAPTEKKIQ